MWKHIPLFLHNEPPALCIVDAFLTVLIISEDIIADFGRIDSRLHLSLVYGILIPVPVQFDDILILHRRTTLLLFLIQAPSLYIPSK